MKLLDGDSPLISKPLVRLSHEIEVSLYHGLCRYLGHHIESVNNDDKIVRGSSCIVQIIFDAAQFRNMCLLCVREGLSSVAQNRRYRVSVGECRSHHGADLTVSDICGDKVVKSRD